MPTARRPRTPRIETRDTGQPVYIGNRGRGQRSAGAPPRRTSSSTDPLALVRLVDPPSPELQRLAEQHVRRVTRMTTSSLPQTPTVKWFRASKPMGFVTTAEPNTIFVNDQARERDVPHIINHEVCHLFEFRFGLTLTEAEAERYAEEFARLVHNDGAVHPDDAPWSPRRGVW